MPRGIVGAFEVVDAAASEPDGKLEAVAPSGFGGAAAEDKVANGEAVIPLRSDTEAGDENVEETPDDTSVLGVAPNAKPLAGLSDGSAGSVRFALNAKLLLVVAAAGAVMVVVPANEPLTALEEWAAN